MPFVDTREPRAVTCVHAHATDFRFWCRLCCVTVAAVGLVVSYEALLRVNEHISTLGFDTAAGESAANWGLAVGLFGQAVLLAVGFITAGSCREKHFRPHTGETKCTHRCKEWGEALVVLVTFVAYLSMVSRVCVPAEMLWLRANQYLSLLLCTCARVADRVVYCTGNDGNLVLHHGRPGRRLPGPDQCEGRVRRDHEQHADSVASVRRTRCP